MSEKMKKCRYCGRDIPEDATFCWYCTRELVARPERPDVTARSGKIPAWVWVLVGLSVVVVIASLLAWL